MLWFAFALLAILLPYIREITFKDLRVVIDKINSASQTLDGAAITAKELRNQLNASRYELIDGYQELLRLLPEDERRTRVIRLSRLYLQEMGIDVTTVKKWLTEIGQPITNLDETIDDEYLNALRNIQQAHGLLGDAIFGYQTMHLMQDLRDRAANR